MVDTYQAVYDAVRSRLSGCDVGSAVAEVMREQNFSHYVQQAAYEWQSAATEQMRPFVVMRPKMFMDGDHWCALYGDNLQDGVCGFGKTPAEASYKFDDEWHNGKAKP